MRTRFKSPSGTGIVELDDEATVGTLFDEIRARTGMTVAEQAAKSLGLHGETLTIVEDETASTQRSVQDTRASSQGRGAPQGDNSAEEMVVPWPEREGTLCKSSSKRSRGLIVANRGYLVLRIMPSDNSCLFTAFGGALPEQIPAQDLRRMMADYIHEHPEVYSEAVLGCNPAEYRRTIQDPDRWGGGIELSILSSIFDIQICTATDRPWLPKTRNLMKFGETKLQRCILVYSGIHYDRVAFSYSDVPHRVASLPPEMDRTLWPVEDVEILQKTQLLVHKLHSAHYYTDTEGLILKCDVPGCGWIGSGQHAGRKHAELTGHVDLTEIADSESDTVLRKCDAPGCDFIGQGDDAPWSFLTTTFASTPGLMLTITR
ncbi:Cyclin PHO80-like protein [Purpureocillium lavendulum]|uniref:Ubiquitin thioesterase OTU n=1 Tax=Purpureocillium lavendulum TaxID=1247861 RepID=A0AB34FMA3_9HYPO|nr:Cyclin PHO80-like protein [Purpureocillium lavendulum]